MERFWNYLFYLQWKFTHNIGVKYIQRPIISTLSFLFPRIKKNKLEVTQTADSTMGNPESGFNLGFAFSHLFITTTIGYGIICFYINLLINYEAGENFKYFLFGVMALSYLTNYWFLWYKDRYLKYFAEFDKKSIPKVHYLYLMLFHLGVIAFGILSIHWTIGFNL